VPIRQSHNAVIRLFVEISKRKGGQNLYVLQGNMVAKTGVMGFQVQLILAAAIVAAAVVFAAAWS
jgi:hypothetical protein